MESPEPGQGHLQRPDIDHYWEGKEWEKEKVQGRVSEDSASSPKSTGQPSHLIIMMMAVTTIHWTTYYL